jgi:endonuclease/exonuclease/phosphatase (EEP) superfamily protein YafD
VLLSPAPAGPRLRVVTCNLHGSKAVDPQALEDFVLESRADVVALQEWPEAGKSSLATWPGWHHHVSSGLFLASQFPIRHVEELGRDSYGKKGLVTRYDLETPAGVVHFFSLHLESPRDGIYEAIHEERQDTEANHAISARRWQQSRYVARHAAELDGPVLLAGDFNTPPESAIFRQVWGDYTDAFGVAGWGWGYTFHGGRTWVRIDHVLMGKGWYCGRCRVGPHVGSPHRPVFAELTWTGPAAQRKPDLFSCKRPRAPLF